MTITAPLDPRQKLLLLQELDNRIRRAESKERLKEEAEARLLPFIRLMWPFVEPARPLIEGWPLDAICEHLEAVTAGQITRLLINIPPGFMKSLVANVFWPAWEWIEEPSLRYIAASYSGTLTIRDNVRFRNVITSSLYREYWGDKFSPGENVTKITNDHTGWKLATSCGGVGTGERADRFVCLPYSATVETDHGDIEIGRVVEEKLDIGVVGYNNGYRCFQRITAHERSPGRPLIIIRHDRGILRCTSDHPVWVEGRGYIPAGTVRVGDRLLCSVRTLAVAPAVSAQAGEGILLLQHLPREGDNQAYRVHLPTLRQALYGETGLHAEKEILLEGMLLCREKDGGTTETADAGSVRQVWDYGPDNEEPAPSRDDGSLFQILSGENKIRWVKKSALETGVPRQGEKNFIRLSDLWGKFREAAVASKRKTRDILFKALRGLRQWQWIPSISYELESVFQGGNSASRQPYMPVMSTAMAGWGPLARSSRQLQLGGSLRTKSYLSMQGLPSREGSCQSPFRSISGGVAESVVRSIGEDQKPRFVYNIRVEPDRNYFADGVLLHNCDDPNSVRQAESEAVTTATNQWFREVVPTRLNNAMTSAIINIQQRTSDLDVSGIILDPENGMSKDYVHLMIPQAYDPSRHCVTVIGWEDPRGADPATREANEGALAWPARFPRAAVERDTEILGEYAASGQFQQSPVPRGGGIFKREHWKEWPPVDWPGRANNSKIVLPPFDFVAASLDTALSQKQTADYSALTIWGIWRSSEAARLLPRMVFDLSGDSYRLDDAQRAKCMLIYGWEKRLRLHGPPEEIPPGMSRQEWNLPSRLEERQKNWGLVQWTVHDCRRFRVDSLLIEVKANGKDVSDELERLHKAEDWGTIMVDPGTYDKVSRAYALQHLWENGVVYAPLVYSIEDDTWGHPAWAQKIIDQFTIFPRGKHDDLVDSSMHALKHMRDLGMLVRTDEEDRSLEQELEYSRPPMPLYPS